MTLDPNTAKSYRRISELDGLQGELIGYVVGYGSSIRPVTWSTVVSVAEARTVAAEMLAKPGAMLTFEVIHDGRAEVLKLEKSKENENGKNGKEKANCRREAIGRVRRESKAIA